MTNSLTKLGSACTGLNPKLSSIEEAIMKSLYNDLVGCIQISDIEDAYSKEKMTEKHYNLLKEKISDYKNNHSTNS